MTCQLSVEYLRNIKKIHVYTCSDELSEYVTAAIDNAFMLGPVSKSQVDGIQVFSFANSVPKTTLPATNFSSFEAKDLKLSSQLACRCGHILCRNPSLVYKDLPSKYWMDLIDCWSCHQSEFAPITNKIDICANGSQLILPAKGTVHVGLEGLLCSRDDMSGGEGGVCGACGEQIGEAMESHIMIYWHMLNISKTGGESILAPSPLKVLLSRLHENMQSFASQAFNITNGEDLVSVTVMNWDLLAFDLTGLAPAVKIVVHREPLANFELVKVDKVTMQSLRHAIQTSWPSINTPDGLIVTLKP